MFDGLYSFISVILSLAALAVCNIIKKRDNKDFPFGKYILEPLVISVNSIVLIIMCLYSLNGAYKALISGGNSINAGSAIIYSIISVVGCGLFYLVIKKVGDETNSELIKSQSMQWLMDGVISAGVLIGFIVVEIILKTSLAPLARYIDPIMVIITSVVFLKTPINILKCSFKEIIGAKIPEEISVEVEKQVQVIKKEYNFIQAVTKVLKIGRSVKIEVNFILSDENIDISLEDMNSIKAKLYEDIDSENYFKDMKVLFSTNKTVIKMA
ncbi:cation transporter [Clostridium chauvoei]|uniref:Cation efflux protein transmembrane domain-containing protein n=3 Tax=Clostridium chauvoei TaxID=46867 RepID=S6FAE3_9CLOT|nr:cation transporter [Clostridium chauvoei]CDG02008.1 Putative Uncharacterized protein [Clostridium chauvoei JF4335]MBX7283314.1 cation transporter [Clostridium chauvoei]MBX7285788.1 cation transporter [Clostridium chauvoei]MBX7288318.1 cation transporter [Clostridium chauvoei]